MKSLFIELDDNYSQRKCLGFIGRTVEVPYVTGYMNSNLSIAIRVYSPPPPLTTFPRNCVSAEITYQSGRSTTSLTGDTINKDTALSPRCEPLAFIRLINNEDNLKWQPLST